MDPRLRTGLPMARRVNRGRGQLILLSREDARGVAMPSRQSRWSKLITSAFLMQVFLVAAMATDAWAHTKGVSLSRFGLLDVSLTGNVAYAGFDKASRIDFDKIGDRHEEGFN